MFIPLTLILITLINMTTLFSKHSLALSINKITNKSLFRNQMSRLYMSSPKELTEKSIKDNKVMIFSKSYCPYCSKAKRFIIFI